MYLFIYELTLDTEDVGERGCCGAIRSGKLEPFSHCILWVGRTEGNMVHEELGGRGREAWVVLHTWGVGAESTLKCGKCRRCIGFIPSVSTLQICDEKLAVSSALNWQLSPGAPWRSLRILGRFLQRGHWALWAASQPLLEKVLLGPH